MRMFGYHIMRTSARRVMAEHGYRSALAFFRRTAARQRALLARHGIALADPRRVPELPPRPRAETDVGRRLGDTLDRLEARLTR
jgi:hypothetical protein